METFGAAVTIALGWMLRSWFLFELLSSCCVRMCHGAPEIIAAPLGSLAVVFQYADCARWPPHAKSAALPDVVNVTTTSPVLLPPTGPLCVGPAMLSIVPPYIVRSRPTPLKACAP